MDAPKKTGGARGGRTAPSAPVRGRSAKAEGPRSDGRAAATQKRILDAAEQEFAQRGFAGARLREIALSAEVQPALIHHYFADKRGLYGAVIERGIGHLRAETFRVLEGPGDMPSLVRGFIDVLVDFHAHHHQLMALVRHESSSGSDELLSRARESLAPVLAVLGEMVATRQAAGEIRGDLSARELILAGLSLILYPAVDGAFVDALLPAPPDERSIARRKAVVATLLLEAMRPR